MLHFFAFAGKRYWRLDPNRNRIDAGYPKQISEGWRGVPNHVDSVYQWNGRIFFFKGMNVCLFSFLSFSSLARVHRGGEAHHFQSRE